MLENSEKPMASGMAEMSMPAAATEEAEEMLQTHSQGELVPKLPRTVSIFRAVCVSLYD